MTQLDQSMGCVFIKVQCMNYPPKAATQVEHQILVFNTDYRLMYVKSIAEYSKEHSAILLTSFVLSNR